MEYNISNNINTYWIEMLELVSQTYLATVKPRVMDFPDTICRATLTMDVPQAAPSPSKPSSVPKGFVWFLTLANVGNGALDSDKIENETY